MDLELPGELHQEAHRYEQAVQVCGDVRDHAEEWGGPAYGCFLLVGLEHGWEQDGSMGE